MLKASRRQVGLKQVRIDGQVLPVLIVDILLQVCQISSNSAQALQDLAGWRDSYTLAGPSYESLLQS